MPKVKKPWHWPFQRISDGPEYSCRHGVGHSDGVHGCCGCCGDSFFPGNFVRIKGNENYGVSKNGNVCRLNKDGSIKNMLHPHKKKGYWWVQLRGPRVYKSIHRLVAETFIPNPGNKRVVNHKDFDTSHNSVGNLEWMTDSENQLWTYQHGHREEAKKSLIQRSRDSRKIKDPTQALVLFEQGLTYVEIAKQLNVHKETVGRAIRRLKKEKKNG